MLHATLTMNDVHHMLGDAGVSGADTSSRRASILVVADTAADADTLARRLERFDFVATTFVTMGAQTVRAACARPTDLVLWQMSARDAKRGLAAARRIRTQLDVPVVVLADSAARIFEPSGLSAPLDYVSVACAEEDLVRALDRALVRHAHERELRFNQTRYDVTLASVADGVIGIDGQGRVSVINPAAEALTLWTADQAIGRPADDVVTFMDETTSAVLASPLLQSLRDGLAVRSDAPVLLLSKDGSAVPVDFNVSAMRDAGGQVLGAVIAFRDLRQRRLSAEALSRVESELRQAQKVEAIGRLAGGVAHDFNNVLTIIIGDTEVLLDNPALTPEIKSILSQVLDAGLRGAELARQLLAFGRRQTLDTHVVNLNQILRQSEGMVQRLVSEHIRVSLSLDEKAPPVCVDAGQMEMVTLNLAANARDAMPAGGVLDISTYACHFESATPERPEDVPPGTYAALAIRDTGVGIPPAVMSHIFEPFFTTKERGHGTGLGLAGVYGTVKQSGGYIYVDSVPGEGTRFVMYFPAARAAQAAQSPAAYETVLIAEDDPTVRSLAASALRRGGYQVVEAVDGEDVLRMAGNPAMHVGLIVIDPQMSACDPTLVSRLRAQGRGTRVLYLSGASARELQRRGIDIGSVPLLRKPFTPRQLSAKLRELFSSPIVPA
jgi:PAS domain S-box-containing protein